MIRIMLTAIFIALLGLCPQAWAQFDQVRVLEFADAMIMPSDGGPYHHFGNVMDHSNGRLIIGARNADHNGQDSGTAYIFKEDPATGMWLEEARLLPSDGEPLDLFGDSVALRGYAAVVGSRYDGDNGYRSGAVYVFLYDPVSGQWKEQAKLLASDGGPNDQFGYAVALHADVIAVGARNDGDNGQGSGSAYVFRYDAPSGSWIEEAKLLASDGVTEQYFGEAVALSGDTLMVGAPAISFSSIPPGRVYVFAYDPVTTKWNEEDILAASNGHVEDLFGSAVSLDGYRAMIGAKRLTHGPQVNSGSVYFFEYDPNAGKWNEMQEIRPSKVKGPNFFGVSVSFSGDVAVIGASNEDTFDDSEGVAYLFDYDAGAGEWLERVKLLAADGIKWDVLGLSVALAGDMPIAGVIGRDENGEDSGAAYVFDLDEGLRLTVDPVPVVAGQSVTFTVSRGEPFRNTILLYGFHGLKKAYLAGLDVKAGLRIPFIGGMRLADSQGISTGLRYIPPILAGHRVWFQALQYRKASNILVVPVQ